MTATHHNPYRALPSIDRMVADERLAALIARHGRDAVVDLAREVVEGHRQAIEAGSPPSVDPVQAVLDHSAVLRPSLVRVINATGVIIHTNLGRAPLARSAVEAMQRVSNGYSNLEYDLEAGERGSRFTHVERLLCHLTGAEAALAVNNNASAVMLALAALCRGREVIISRGQLVEIGGGFRIPDVLRQSGADLVEVGTTNRTRLADNEAAITDRTAAILRVHPSNFRVIGFTEDTPLADLVRLGHERGLTVIDDLGSGALLDTREFGLAAEPTLPEAVRTGADVVLASGDNLLGGPQAGIAVGRADAIASMRRHPLARAVRMDKGSIAALSATLEHYRRGDAVTEIPVWRMIALDADTLGRRARRWSRACGEHAVAEAGRSTVGGGSLPGEELDTVVCAVTPPDGHASAFAARLREASPAIIARCVEGRVLLDPRTGDPAEDLHVEITLARLCGRPLPESAAD
ncbi:MAG: L-seryl-tRNA(Sec) selenium transferase [Dehalococcoidia bacterium]|nr:L-seryl-tRNA(Sec) selenium transferase [Dehalococcoidia bacterium]